MSIHLPRNNWALSYPSHPERGRWHKIDPTDPYETGTLCGKFIDSHWKKTPNFPLMWDDVTNKLCKNCHKKDPLP